MVVNGILKGINLASWPMNDYLKGKKKGKHEVRNGVELDSCRSCLEGESGRKNKIKVYFGAKIVMLGNISCISALA